MERELKNDIPFVVEKLIQNNNDFVDGIKKISDEQTKLNKEFKDLVINAGDSNAELVISRGEFDWLPNRLDNFDSQMETKAYKIYLTPEDFGAKGDSITDDTDSINKCLSYYGNIPCTINFNKNYLVSNKLNVKSNTVLNLNNSKFLFENESNIINDTTYVSNSHWYGILNCEGLPTTTKTKILGVSDSSSNGISTLRTKFNIESNVGFELCDYIAIDIDRVGNQTKDTYRPSCNMMARIIELGDGYIITDYHTPFDFTDIDFNANNYYITKVTPCENVVINNFNARNISNYSEDKKILASGVGIIYGANIIINNAKGYNISNPLVISYYAHNIKVSDVENIKPSHVGDGQGYAVKLCRTYLADVENLYGDKCRHLIDLSGSARVEVDFGKGINTTNGDFDLHGMCEHDIIFRNCFGQFYFGNGFEYFPSLMQDVVLENCKGKSSFNNIINLKIDKCDFQYDNQGGENTILNVEVYNSKIHFIRQGDSRIMGATRGDKIIPTITFDNVIFDSPNNGIGCYPNFMNIYRSELNNCKIKFENVKGKIKIIDCDNFIIKGGYSKSCIFEPIRTLNGVTEFIIDDLQWKVDNSDSISDNITLRDVFGFNAFATGLGTLNLTIKNSDFNTSITNTSYPFMYIETPVLMNCEKINVTSRNNKFDSNNQYCGKVQLRDNEKFTLSNFGSEYTKNIANFKHIWNNAGNSLTDYENSLITGKEFRVMSSNGLGIGIVSDGTNIKLKKYINGNYSSDIAVY